MVAFLVLINYGGIIVRIHGGILVLCRRYGGTVLRSYVSTLLGWQDGIIYRGVETHWLYREEDWWDCIGR